MQEKLLHFIWQYQYFSPASLCSESGVSIQVINPGVYNEHAGPDFLHAHICIGNVTWRGHVELHIKASDWKAHNHHKDPAYDAVILHVVWENNATAIRSEGTSVTTIALRDKISRSVFKRYTDLSQNLWHIPCNTAIREIDSSIIHEAKSRAFFQRLQSKVDYLLNQLDKYNGDWEEIAFQLLIRYSGAGRNMEGLSQLTQRLNYRTIQRHADRPDQVESMLFGVAGFLEGPGEDAYHQGLIDEFRFLQRKYSFKTMPLHMWKFLRMRPSNFPSRRLASLVGILCQRRPLFSGLMACSSFQDIHDFFQLNCSSYWSNHYMFGKESRPCKFVYGKAQIAIFAINVIGPLQAAYRSYHHQIDWLTRSEDFYRQLPAENNRYLRLWETLDVHALDAWDSQSLMGLYLSGCCQKGCLDCPVGQQILKMPV